MSGVVATDATADPTDPGPATVTGTGPRWRGWARASLVASMLLLLLAPFVPLVLASFAEGYFYPQVLPERPSTRAWARVLDPSAGAWQALATTTVVGAWVTVSALVVGVPAGRVLGTARFRGRRVVEVALLLPVLVPAIAVAIGIHVVFIRLGLDGGVAGVVLAHLIPATPYVVLLSAGVFANLDLELEQQARSLGAAWWRTQWYVTLRLAGPGLAVAAMFAFLVSWGQYVLTLVIGGGRVVTLPILLFATASGGDVSVTAALALFHSLPALLVLLVVSRTLDGRPLTRIGGAR